MRARRGVILWLVCGMGVTSTPLGAAGPGQDAGRVSPARTRNADVKKLERPGLENLFRLSARLYSGGQPEGEAAFETLRALGVQTIVSVDGGVPDLERAHRYGMRYVHLPTGYGAVRPDVALGIAAIIARSDEPVYIHCHHGKHRGPAAAAIALRSMEGWTTEECHEWMKAAGTSASYPGLYESVANYRAPSREELLRAKLELPERARVPRLVEAMVEIDALWDEARGVRGKAGEEETPDERKARVNALVLLEEQFRELLRREDVQARGQAFAAAFKAAAADTAALRAVLGHANAPENAALLEETAALKRVAQSCVDCHQAFRDRRGR